LYYENYLNDYTLPLSVISANHVLPIVS